MDDEDPEVRATLAAIGAWEITAALLTRPHPDRLVSGEPAGAAMIESGPWSRQSMPDAPAVRPAVVWRA